MKTWMLWVCVLLMTACASTSLPQQRWEMAEAEAEECDDPGADRCTTFICGEGACALYFCEDVDPGRIVRAQAGMLVRPAPPMPGPRATRLFPAPDNPQRFWGSMQALLENAELILIIPWDESSEKYAERLRKEMEDAPGTPGRAAWAAASGLPPPEPARCMSDVRPALAQPSGNPILDAASLPVDRYLFRLANFMMVIVATERFAEAVRRLGFDEVQFRKLPSR